jgi:hypothetical protein
LLRFERVDLVFSKDTIYNNNYTIFMTLIILYSLYCQYIVNHTYYEHSVLALKSGVTLATMGVLVGILLLFFFLAS